MVAYVASALILLGSPLGALGVTTHSYTYDAAGNVVLIERTSPSALAIASFAPTAGATGTVVAVDGAGFLPIPSLNAVSFNGAAATVLAASFTRIIASVPGGATTGPISVTVGGATAVSATPFTVSDPDPPPTITSFTPIIGVAGSEVVVSGTHFNPAPGATAVHLNSAGASVVQVETAILSARVPALAGSGRLRVTTPAGTVLSADDFIVPPGNLSPIDIVARARFTVGGPAVSLAIAASSNKHGIVLFEASAGAHLSVDLPTYVTSASAVLYRVYKPDNSLLAEGFVSASTRTIHLPVIPATGTYSILFSPGPFTLGLTARLVANAAFTIDGASAGGAFDYAGQSVRLVVGGTAGQNVGGFASLDFGTASDHSNLVLESRRPSAGGLDVSSCAKSDTPCDFEWPTLPETGSYTVVVGTQPSLVGSFSLLLSNEVAGTLTPGVPYNVTISRQGQDARLSFAGTASQSIRLKVRAIALSGATYGRLSVLTPGGGVLATQQFTAGGSHDLDLPPLPVSGAYAVLIDPADGATASMEILVAPADLAVTGVTVEAVTSSLSGAYDITVSFTVTNNGTVDVTPTWYDEAFLSTDASLDDADPKLSGSHARLTSLPGGGSYTQTFTFTTPTTQSAGDYTLFVKTDSSGAASSPGAVIEADEANNRLGVPVTLPQRLATPLMMIILDGDD
jgi:hypothetical protein